MGGFESIPFGPRCSQSGKLLFILLYTVADPGFPVQGVGECQPFRWVLTSDAGPF